MGINLTDLTIRQIDAEECLRKAGYEDEANECRWQWNHYPDHALESVVEAFERTAALARAHPRRGALPAVDAPLCAAAAYPMNEAWVRFLDGRAYEERQRRAVD